MTERVPDKERVESLATAVTFNQIRNAIGILTEMMEETYRKHDDASEQDIINRLRRMGKNIGVEFSRYWEPGQKGVENMLLSMYKAIFGTNVSVEEPADKKSYHDYRNRKVYDVIDKKCPLCKEKRATNIAGCELVIGVVEGMFEAMARRHPGADIPLLKAEEVLESKTRGDDRCKHRYVLDRPDHK
nr:hypothetical protein [Candidatus Sigynarchaeota archaeon]